MSEFLFGALLVPYGLVLAALFIYGLNLLYLVAQAWRFDGPDPPLPPLEHPVHVTVQVPIYNERYVARRALDAAARLRWPRDSLEIQILDDSTDDTLAIVGERVAYWQAQGVRVRHICRAERRGYKAGALAHGTHLARGEFLAVFDADFVPPPDFLERTVPHLVADSGLAFVQARWDHLNTALSPLTRLQAIALDAHFGVEQFARSRAGHLFNFNGTAGVWRREAVEAVGGWRANTLTEDLDLSYRVLLAGWRGLFLRDLVAPAELPSTMPAFRRQQSRWAQGTIECALFLVPQILRSRLRLRDKTQAIIHLSGYGLHALLVFLALLYPLVTVVAGRHPELATLYGFGFLFSLTIFAPSVFFLYGQAALGREWWRVVPDVLAVSVLGLGMMLNSLRAMFRALSRGERVFERTPKWGQVASPDRAYRLGAERGIWLEVVWGVFNLGTAAFASTRGQAAIAVFSALFGVGALCVALMTLVQGRSQRAAS